MNLEDLRTATKDALAKANRQAAEQKQKLTALQQTLTEELATHTHILEWQMRYEDLIAAAKEALAEANKQATEQKQKLAELQQTLAEERATHTCTLETISFLETIST